MPTPTKWSNILKQFAGISHELFVCLTILWGWHLKGLMRMNLKYNIQHIRVRTFLEEPETVWGKLQPNLFTKK